MRPSTRSSARRATLPSTATLAVKRLLCLVFGVPGVLWSKGLMGLMGFRASLGYTRFLGFIGFRV